MVLERKVNQRKLDYRARLEGYLRQYSQILLVSVDMVGSQQMQNVRMQLRGKGALLMGKNTIIRMVLREMVDEIPTLELLIPYIRGNVGMVFTDEDLTEIRQMVTAEKVPAAARPGVVAPVDVRIPAGATGLDPGQTSFFQALNIATKIVRGSIEILNPVHLVKQGEKVTPSAVSLLQKLDIRPFEYGIQVEAVYEGGCVYDSAILDMTDADLIAKFQHGVTLLTCLSLAIGRPNACTLPHSFARAFKKIVALAVMTDITFKEAEMYKEYLDDPEAYAAKHGITATTATEDKKDDAPAAKEEEEEEEEEESDGGMGFDLFD